MAGYIIKVTIENTHPPVWRRIIIPEKISFGDLHKILQTAFQWEGAHMHDFSFPGTRAKVVMREDACWCEDDVTEGDVLVDSYLTSYKYIRYTYDFGDDWHHKIVFEKEDPNYQLRYASVIKYKGDSFEEDCGGIWGCDDEENRVAFSLDEANERLQKTTIPVRKETKKNKRHQNKVETEKALKELYRLISEAMREEAEAAKIESSEMAVKTERWMTLYGPVEAPNKICVIKNISRKSCVELLTELDIKGVREYCRYIGAKTEDSYDIRQCAVQFWEELEKHPEHLAYIFYGEELEEMIELVQAPNCECSRIPDYFVVEKLLVLGLFDLGEEIVNRNKYVVLRQVPEAKMLVERYTKSEWKRISKEHAKRIENCNFLLNMYSMMTLDSFCDKYREYFKASESKDEILRAVYLGGTLCRELQTAQEKDGTVYIAQNAIDMEKVLLSQREEGVDLEYRPFTPAEKKRFSYGYGEAYPVWTEYFDYLMEYYEMDDWEIEEYLLEDYENVKNGEGAEVLWDRALDEDLLTSIDSYVNFWRLFFGACLTTGLPKYMGYSREEYADIKGISPVELDIYAVFVPKKRITKKTHLYEFPLEYQLQLYGMVKHTSDRKTLSEMETFIQELGVRNYELEYIFSIVLLNMDEYDRAEKYLKEISKAYPDDETVDMYLDGAEMMGNPGDEEDYSVWDMMDGKMTKSNIVTFRRDQPKIGRNDPCPCGSGKKYKKCCGKNK